jgi:eukaryotic-like serine/threonine-protein kinase
MPSDVNEPSRSHMIVGTVVADTYRLEALIGRGGMGDVFSASHLRLPGKQVAIKFLHPDVADPEILARFRREAEIASRLGHPNIVTVLDFNSLPDGTPYLVLEYLVGETLDDALASGPFSVERMLVIARQLGSALAAAHRASVVHRDLKPANIFLVPTEIDGHVGEIAKILDFGISKIRGSQTVKTQDSALLGTPQYMSPEQATGKHDAVDGRTDIFALGAIFYEMLSGRAAFAGSSIPEVVFKVVYEPAPPLAQLVPNIPPVVLAAIERAMQKKPDDRFASVGDLVTALTGVELATLPGRAGTPIAIGSGGSRPGGSRKVSSPDAMARTLGSGDHAEALMATAHEPSATGAQPQAEPASAAPSAAPAFGTLAGSSSHAAGGYPGSTPPVLPTPAYPAPTMGTAGAGAGRWKWIAVAMAALLAAVVAFAIVKQRAQPVTTQVASNGNGNGSAGQNGSSGSTGSGSATPDQPALPAAAGVDAGIRTVTVDAAPDAAHDAAHVPTSRDAGATVHEDAGSGAHGKPSKPPRPSSPTQPPRPPTEEPVQDDGAGMGAASETVDKAWKAAERGNDLAAKKLANSILDTAGTSVRARTRAHQIIALVACRADDRETAVRAARSARTLPRLVIQVCKEHDIDLPRRGR